MKYICVILLLTFSSVAISENWYFMTKSNECEENSPSKLIKSLQITNTEYITEDLYDDDKIIGVMISAPPIFNEIIYIKSMELCKKILNHMLTKKEEELEKYK